MSFIDCTKCVNSLAILKLLDGLQEWIPVIEDEGEKQQKTQPRCDKGGSRWRENIPKVANRNHAVGPAAGGGKERRRHLFRGTCFNYVSIGHRQRECSCPENGRQVNKCIETRAPEQKGEGGKDGNGNPGP